MADSEKPKPFGYEYLMDLYNCKPGVCHDYNLCYLFLDRLVDLLKMQKQAPPLVFRIDSSNSENTGITGWVPLIESGVQIHTRARKSFISIDVYSCREFSTDGVEEFVRAYFGPQEVDAWLIPRGQKYFSQHN